MLSEKFKVEKGSLKALKDTKYSHKQEIPWFFILGKSQLRIKLFFSYFSEVSQLLSVIMSKYLALINLIIFDIP